MLVVEMGKYFAVIFEDSVTNLMGEYEPLPQRVQVPIDVHLVSTEMYKAF